MLEEVGEHVPHFGSESYELTSTVENMEAGVQFTVTKSVDHLAPFLNSSQVSRGLAHSCVPYHHIRQRQAACAIRAAVLRDLCSAVPPVAIAPVPFLNVTDYGKKKQNIPGPPQQDPQKSMPREIVQMILEERIKKSVMA